MKFSFCYLFILPVLLSAQEIPKGYKLACKLSFENKKDSAQFVFTQASKWRISKAEKGNSLEFTGISDYQPPFRSPHTIGVIKKMKFGSFILEADLLQTGKEYGHRDMCIIFGMQDPSHFYYSHIATKMDDNAHQIMVVNEAPRRKISSFTTEGVEWGQEQWHRVRVERNVETGSIRVFYDGKLIQESVDKTFDIGYIGFGSFDDSGKIDNITIWSDQTIKSDAKFFN
jgi:hypothetical protein